MSILCSISVFSQKVSDEQKVKAKVIEMNEQIVSEDASLGLTKEQQDNLYAIHFSRLTETIKVKKAGGSKEEVKVVNKSFFKRIYSEVLNSKQKKALKSYKEKNKKQ